MMWDATTKSIAELLAQFLLRELEEFQEFSATDQDTQNFDPEDTPPNQIELKHEQFTYQQLCIAMESEQNACSGSRTTHSVILHTVHCTCGKFSWNT